jgi:hypothetical protein
LFNALHYIQRMTRLEKIEQQIADLNPAERKKLLHWLSEFEEAAFDRQIEDDIKAGRLDALADAVLADHRAGRTRPL